MSTTNKVFWTTYGDDSNAIFMAIARHKEEEDLEQTYIRKAAKDFKEGSLPKLKGAAWFDK